MIDPDHITALHRAVAAIAPRFESANPIPVEKATVPTQEWLALKAALFDVMSGLRQGIRPFSMAAEKHQDLTCRAFVNALVESGVVRKSSAGVETYAPGHDVMDVALAKACRQMDLVDVSDAKLSELFGGY